MNRACRWVTIAMGLLAAVWAGSALAAEGWEAQDQAAMMEAWEAAKTPGEHHKYFEFFIGDWDSEVTMFMGSEPLKSTATTRYEWILGGRYAQSRMTGEFMGAPMNGVSLDGYDNVAGEYFNIWIDDMGTGYLLSKGTLSENGKSMTYVGSMQNPMGMEVEHRMVTTITGKNSYTFDMYMTMPGAPETLGMKALYTRR